MSAAAAILRTRPGPRTNAQRAAQIPPSTGMTAPVT
jgi:hypothetical protein